MSGATQCLTIVSDLLARDEVSFASKHVVTMVFVHDPPHNMGGTSPPSEIEELNTETLFSSILRCMKLT